MDEIICVYETYDSTEANLIKAHLESADISCYLKSDNAGGTLPHLTSVTGIGIMIRKEDTELALKIINRE